MTDRRPESVRADKGGEFTSRLMVAFFKRHRIKHFVTQNAIHAGYCEPFQRTLKNKIERYMTHNNTMRYITDLQKLVHSYNETKNRTISIKPNEVTRENHGGLLQKLYCQDDSKKCHATHYHPLPTVVSSKGPRLFPILLLCLCSESRAISTY